MIIKEIKAKSALTKSKLPEADYCLNPYIGCAHGCIYCYARFMRRFTGHLNDDWGQFVDVKVNIAELLEKELAKNPKLGAILLGSVTDAYQPVEKKYGITKAILKVLSRYQYPLSILTKSDLVLRDIDILTRISSCEVGLTITSLEQKYLRVIEPLAVSPDRRVESLSRLHEAGIKTYAFIGPVLPGITNLPEILAKLAGSVDFVMIESLNQRFGDWNNFIKIISSAFPDIGALYQKRIDKQYWDGVEQMARRLCEENQIELKGFYRH